MTGMKPEIPLRMKAVVTEGPGGYEMLSFRDVEVPVPLPGEVLIEVLAAGINNTDINTRVGWYGDAAPGQSAGWSGTTVFPLIQGTDCCGRVVKAEDARLLGRRVLVRSCMRTEGFGSMRTQWLASERDGAFAQFVKVPASEVFPVISSWSDAELATIPCSYGTAESMLHRARVKSGDRIFVTGASGGVGSAVVQLAKRRGAEVIASTSPAKFEAVRAIGASQVFGRGIELLAALGEESVDVVIDNVAGTDTAAWFKLLRRGGRYASSGAISGAQVTLDWRDLYLKDLTVHGCTAWDEPVFPNIISYIERSEIRPLLAGSFPLADIVEAQREFLKKEHVGNYVLIPPAARLQV